MQRGGLVMVRPMFVPPLPDVPPDLEARCVPAEDGEVAVFSFAGVAAALPSTLSDAERAVVLGIFEGHSNAQIARARGRSIRTIANQVARAFRKLGVKSRGELVARLCRAPRV
jgi:DNA-binding CsgD family transcriptional regulator